MTATVLYGVAGLCAVVLAVMLIAVLARSGGRAFVIACFTATLGALAGVTLARLIAG